MKFSIKDSFSKCDKIRRKPNVAKPAGVFLIRLISDYSLDKLKWVANN